MTLVKRQVNGVVRRPWRGRRRRWALPFSASDITDRDVHAACASASGICAGRCFARRAAGCAGPCSWVAHPDIKPPVAILVYPADEPRRAVYFPMAVFSPEWQALTWAASSAVPVRFMDLPQSHQLAIENREKDLESTAAETPEQLGEAQAEGQPSAEPSSRVWRTDPLAILAEAAGYHDHELWWEDQIERRTEASQLFAAINEVMSAVRAEFPDPEPRDLVREASMRRKRCGRSSRRGSRTWR